MARLQFTMEVLRRCEKEYERRLFPKKGDSDFNKTKS